MEKTLTLSQVATLKHVSVRTVRKWIDQGILPAYRDGAKPKHNHDTRPIYVLETDLKHVSANAANLIAQHLKNRPLD